jgi:transposase
MDKHIAREAVRKEQAMTRQSVIVKAIKGRLRWGDAAEILGISPRQMRRIRAEWEEGGWEALMDHRDGRFVKTKILADDIREICRLKEEEYPDYNMKHFHEQLTEVHGFDISYTWTRKLLQEAGIVKKAKGRGKHRRRRERRPMRGMMLHIDGSTHEWIPGLPMWDLIVVMDDADGQILFARFVEEEGTLSTFEAIKHVLVRWGRFCELYHDRGSHFGRTAKAGEEIAEEQNGQVTRALKALGIRQIFGYSPQARGRSERAFGTIQGRLPQELRVAGIRTYEAANDYLEKHFVPDFNKRFTVVPAQAELAFTKLVGIDLKLLLSVQEERIVRNDNTVTFHGTVLQIPPSRNRPHFVRCPVTVHQFVDQTLGVSHQGKLLATYSVQGEILSNPNKRKKKKSKRNGKKKAA